DDGSSSAGERLHQRAGSVDARPLNRSGRKCFLLARDFGIRVGCVRGAGADALHAGGEIGDEEQPAKLDCGARRRVRQRSALLALGKDAVDDRRMTSAGGSRGLSMRTWYPLAESSAR